MGLRCINASPTPIPDVEHMNTTQTEPRPEALFPARTKVLVVTLVAAVLTGALFLIGVRAEALMIDLAKIGQAFCF